MNQWIKTANGTLLPTHQVIRIERRKQRTPSGRECINHSVITEVGDQFNIDSHDLPTSGSFIGNHNPDLVILSVWADEPDFEPFTVILPIIGWSVMGAVGSEEAMPITLREQMAVESRGILDRRTGAVLDYDEQFESADAYIADVVRRRKQYAPKPKDSSAAA